MIGKDAFDNDLPFIGFNYSFVGKLYSFDSSLNNIFFLHLISQPSMTPSLLCNEIVIVKIVLEIIEVVIVIIILKCRSHVAIYKV